MSKCLKIKRNLVKKKKFKKKEAKKMLKMLRQAGI